MVQSKRKAESGNESGTAVKDEEFQVAKILGKRHRKGKVQYLIRWLDCGPEVDSWEPLKHLRNCSQLISDYEQELTEARMKRKRTAEEEVQVTVNDNDLNPNHPSSSSSSDLDLSSDSENEDVAVFYQSLENFELEKITGAYKKEKGSSSTLMFEVKWRHSDEPGVVPAKFANVKWPQMVIQYYESISHWEVVGVEAKNGWVPCPIHRHTHGAETRLDGVKREKINN